MESGENFQNSESLHEIAETFKVDRAYILAAAVSANGTNCLPEKVIIGSFSRSAYFSNNDQYTQMWAYQNISVHVKAFKSDFSNHFG
jgi:hypothetical protein